jgi:hypothetical protein
MVELVAAGPSVVGILSVVALIGMALSLADINTAVRKLRGSARGAGTQEVSRALIAHFNTLGNPDVQFVAYSGLQSADAVIANAACVLYCLFGKKPSGSTVDSWLKGSDHATVAAANGDIVAKFKGTDSNSASLGNREYLITFADGLVLGTGLTLGAHTTVNGNSKSLVADAPTGFAIIGAAL